MAGFQFQPYESNLTATIGELMQAGPRAQAAALRARGQNTANSIAGIGQAVNGTLGAILQHRADAPRRELEQMQLQGARDEATLRKEAVAASKDFTTWVKSRPAPPSPQEIIGRYGPELGGHFVGLMKSLYPAPKYGEHDPTKAIWDENTGQVTTPAVPKAPDPYTLGEGQVRYDADGNAIAYGPDKTPTAPAGFTLGEGQVRYGPDGKVIASRPKAADPWEGLFGTKGSLGLSTLAPGEVDDAMLAKLPTATAEKVKAIAEGRLQIPARIAKGDTFWQGLLDLTVKYDPSFDAINYNARNKARSDFISPNGVAGKQINGLNTAIGHLDELAKAAEALENGNVQLWNQLANGFKTQFGWTGKTDFDTIAPKVADEVERLWRGSGGSEGSIERTLASLNSNMAPGQNRGAIAKSAALIESKLSSLEQQRDQALGRFGKDIKVIFPASRATLDRLQGTKAAPATPAVGSIVSYQGKSYKVKAIANGRAVLEPQ